MHAGNLLALIACAAMTVQSGVLEPAAATPRPAADRATPSPSGPVPSVVPAASTPWVLDGEVTEIVQVGGVMVAGGLFRRASNPMGGATYRRSNLVAFDASTGRISRHFRARTNGRVRQLLRGPVPGTVYVAGDFTRINGRGPAHLQLLDVRTGRAVRWFRPPATNGRVTTLEKLPGRRLFVGGAFTKLAGVRRGQLVTLDAKTGAYDPFLTFRLVGRHNNTGSGARAPIGPRESAVTPSGNRLVVAGNFRKVGRLLRDQIVMISLTGRRATVTRSWNTMRYRGLCRTRADDTYMRDVEMSPDGSFFVVATTGGPTAGTLCDTAARFETYARGTALQPTWTARSGGDTLWGVEVTSSAVYLGGHNRWLNNPHGRDSAGQGAVPRPGLAALDPRSGVPLAWNPGRHPRGKAAYEILATSAGVWVVSDTKWIGNRRHRRPRIAFFPYGGGTRVAPEVPGTLPGTVYLGSESTEAALIGFDGTHVTSHTSVTAGGVDWAGVRGAVMIGATLFHGSPDGFLYRRSRAGDGFGAPVRVDPYRDPSWAGVTTGSGPPGQTYAGALPAWYGELPAVTGMFYADGRMYYSLSGHRRLYWRWFSPDSGIVGGVEYAVPGTGVDWSSTSGMFLAGRALYFVDSSDGHLRRIGFVSGAVVGAPVMAESTTDWRGGALFLMPPG